MLTHLPQDARPADTVTFLDCSVAEAVRIGLEAAQGKNLQMHSPSIGVPLRRLNLIDGIDIHIAPVLLGDGIRLYDVPGGEIRHLRRDGDDPSRSADLHYRPIRA